MRERLVTRFGQPLLAAILTLPLLLACGGDGDGDAASDEAASRRVRPAAGAEAPVPPPPDTPAIPLVGEIAPGEGPGQTEAPARPQPKLAKPTRPEGPKPPAPPRPPYRTRTPEEAQVAKLVPGAPMPKSFPGDLPVPSDAQPVAAFDGGPERATVAYESPHDVQRVLSDLEQGYLGAGWEVQVASGKGQALIWARKPDHIVMAAVTPTSSGGTRIEVSSMSGKAAK